MTRTDYPSSKGPWILGTIIAVGFSLLAFIAVWGMTDRDLYTSTVDGAAAHAAGHAAQFEMPEEPAEIPSAEELALDEKERQEWMRRYIASGGRDA